MTENHKEIPVLSFADKQSFRNWLKNNFTKPGAYWLKFAKKLSKETTISYEEAREVAISFGWIDGLRNRLDEDYYLIRFTHRRSKSIWSKINVSIADELIADNRMHPEGVKEVEAAKKDGRCDKAY